MTWLTKKLGEFVEKLNLKKASVGSWPYIEIGDIDIENKSIIFKDKKSIRGAIIAPADSVLISRVRPTRGAIVYIDKDYVVSSAFSILKPKLSESFSKFLFYWLGFSKNFFQYLQKKQKGSNYPSVRDKDILNFKIHIPPLKIQQKIVERLDAIKKAQELNDKQIALAEELFQSLLRKEFKLKDKWNKRPLGELVESSQLGLVRSKMEQGVSCKYPYVKMDNITLLGDLVLDSLVRVEADEQEVKKYRLQNGDFLFNTRNTPELVGKSAIFDPETRDETFLYNNNILRIRFEKEASSFFINYYLHTLEGKRQLDIRKQGTTSVCAIYQGDLFTSKIPLPPVKTQRKIVEKLSAVQDYKKKLLEQKQKLQELFDSVLSKSMRDELTQ